MKPEFLTKSSEVQNDQRAKVMRDWPRRPGCHVGTGNTNLEIGAEKSNFSNWEQRKFFN